MKLVRNCLPSLATFNVPRPPFVDCGHVARDEPLLFHICKRGIGSSTDDDEYADEDHNGHNSANFQARSFRLCMIIDLDNT